MQTIKLYLYPQNINLQIFDSGIITVEDRNVYTKPLVVFKGINNYVQILVKNADQKSINITGMTFYAEILKSPAQDFIGTLPVTIVDGTNGIASVNIPSVLINPVPLGYYTLLINVTSSGITQPGYIDDNYGIAINFVVKNGYSIDNNVYESGQNFNMGSLDGEVVKLTENFDMGNIPDLEDEIRDLGEL
jgi:hypothetical protein